VQAEGKAMSQDKQKQLVAEARKIARQVDSWIALSNALTDPNGGLIARYFPDSDERQAFLRSAAYEELNQLLRRTIERRGLYPPPSSGKRAAAH
jgi:hypothetical protein